MGFQAVILAGGKGTRISSILGNLPKALAPISGRPLIDYQIRNLKNFGCYKIVFLVNHLSQAIEDYCQSQQNWGLEILFLKDPEDGIGTAGSLLSAIKNLGDSFLVTYADTFFEIDFNKFWDFHFRKNADVSILAHPNNHPFDSDLIEINHDQRVLKLHAYPHPKDVYLANLVNAALYIFNRNIFDHLDKFNGDIAKDLFPILLSQGVNIYAYKSFEYIKDAGTPNRLIQVNKDFLKGLHLRSRLNCKQSIILLDRDGTLNELKGHISSPNDLVLIKNASNGVKLFNNNAFRVCLITNQPVIARGECTIEGLDKIHKKLESDLGNHGAYLDEIYYCPHHPDKGFKGEIDSLKIQCSCRKPGVSLATNAIRDFNGDLESTWFIGDSTSDIECAKRLGVRSILVETGFAGKDSKFKVLPDYTMPDLESAAKLITKWHPEILDKCITVFTDLDLKFIFIGGYSRVGKSNFASILFDTLKAITPKSIKIHLINFDRWLISENDRGKSANLLTKFRTDELVSLVRTIDSKSRNNESYKVQLPFYNKFAKSGYDTESFLDIMPNDIVIFEGVVAGYVHQEALQQIRNSYYIYISLNEKERKRRILNEYINIRGFNGEDANNIYNLRRNSENIFLENQVSSKPDLTFNNLFL